MAQVLCRLAEQLHQEEQLKEKDKQKADALLKQAQLEEAERHRKADEALQRAECVRQRRALKVRTEYFLVQCTRHTSPGCLSEVPNLS